ncbi:hypothetical protein LCGC14_1360790 [marine sediment metagenome]|uniref:Calcineurin-like phosphoesterase domain-containing protein n=1 Tax=marine sediment metagenome TaxID=412755 RepID=A0A0F9MNL7_9ZZZZ
MRVVVFSDVHWLSERLQVELYEYDPLLDYAPFLELCEVILSDPPDVVVNLGDFAATYEDNPLPEVYQKMHDTVKVVQLRGNHDPESSAFDYTVLDDVRYEHGHKLMADLSGEDASVEGYIKRLRERTKDERLVHGHTHQPAGPWPLDVGSVTFSGTYGEVIDGEARWLRLRTFRV